MHPMSLTALADQHLILAREAGSGRSALTIHGGHGHRLRHTLIALTDGRQLDDHENPGEATLQVVRGAVRLVSGDTSVAVALDDLLVIPPGRHSVVALVDSVVLLTVALQG